jgi:hypothetical protein
LGGFGTGFISQPEAKVLRFHITRGLLKKPQEGKSTLIIAFKARLEEKGVLSEREQTLDDHTKLRNPLSYQTQDLDCSIPARLKPKPLKSFTPAPTSIGWGK